MPRFKTSRKGVYPEGQPARWPQYLPFPQPIRWGWRPVPNSNSVDWPQAQFAPKRLPPGSPSYQPYRYPDGGITQVVWPKATQIVGDFSHYDVQASSFGDPELEGESGMTLTKWGLVGLSIAALAWVYHNY